MKKTLPAIVVVILLVIALWCAVGVATGNIQMPTSTVDTPDCDTDDKIGKWDTADCGPSPVPAVRRTPAASPKKTR